MSKLLTKEQMEDLLIKVKKDIAAGVKYEQRPPQHKKLPPPLRPLPSRLMAVRRVHQIVYGQLDSDLYQAIADMRAADEVGT